VLVVHAQYYIIILNLLFRTNDCHIILNFILMNICMIAKKNYNSYYILIVYLKEYIVYSYFNKLILYLTFIFWVIYGEEKMA